MPKISLAVMENKMRTHYAERNRPAPDRRMVRVLAKEAARRFEDFTSTPEEMDLLLAYCLDYQDPVGEEASDNVDAEYAANAARRVAA